MFEILILAAFLWLLIKIIGLGFRVAWGAAKIVAAVLFTLAIPSLLLCLVFAGGVLLLLPLGMIGIAFGLLKAAV